MTPELLLHLSDQGVDFDRTQNGQWVRLGSVPFQETGMDAAIAQVADRLPSDSAFCLVIPVDELTQTTLDGTDLTSDDIRDQLQDIDSDALWDSVESDGKTHVVALSPATIQQAHGFVTTHDLPIHSFAALPKGAWGTDFAFFGAGPHGVADALAPVGPFVLASDVAPALTPAAAKLTTVTPTPENGAPTVRLETGQETQTAPPVTAVATAGTPATPAPVAQKTPATAPATAPKPDMPAKPTPAPVPKRAKPGYVGGKPKFLGLLLTVLLFLFLLAMGAWA
ncbi:MAG: hypothetical protein AAF386_13195, partial [Pseudomonadota bacterium]